MADYFYCVGRVDDALAPIDGIVPVLGGFSIHLTTILWFVSTPVQNQSLSLITFSARWRGDTLAKPGVLF